MAYATVADLIARFTETEIARLTGDENASTLAVNATRCLQALESASALADTYLRAQVSTPMSSPPLPLVDAVCHLARYDLAHGAGRSPSDQMKTRRDEAIAWLKSVARGEAQLAEVAPQPAQGGRFIDRARILSNDTLKSFI